MIPKKKEIMIDVKVMQTAFIIREDLDISHKQIQNDYSAEMKMIAFAIGSIVEKATKEAKDASDDSRLCGYCKQPYVGLVSEGAHGDKWERCSSCGGM